MSVTVCLSLLFACQTGQGTGKGDGRDHSHDIKYSTAFMSSAAPDGYATPYTVAFCSGCGTESAVAQNVSFEEIAQFSAELAHPPRTDHFNSFIPAELDSLLPVLDYAMYNGYDRICVPSSEFDDATVLSASRYLKMIYYVNDNGITARKVSGFVNDAGETVNYIYLSIMGLTGVDAAHYREAIDEAKRIVDTVPEDYNEYETAMYLYRYLTVNVDYYSGDYYGDTDWNLLYDALIKKKTVCAGYSEAMYVLYNLAGIECFPIYGYINDSSYSFDPSKPYHGGHVWNIAKLGDTYYEFDPTWDAGSLMADFLFFADSTDDLCSYYPREVAQFTDDYCVPRSESLFPRVDLNYDTVDRELLSIACTVFNYAHTDPLELLAQTGYQTNLFSIKAAADGWLVTPVAYEEFYSILQYFIADELIDIFFDGYIRNEDGKLAFRPDLPCGETYRFCNAENGNAGILIFDERGNFTPVNASYHIGIKDDHYVLDTLSLLT